MRVTVYERRHEGQLTWWPLVPAGRLGPVRGRSEVRLRDELGKQLREVMRHVDPAEQEAWELPPGVRLHHVHLDVHVRGPSPVRVAGRFPLVAEPRWFTEQHQRLCAFHPFDTGDWFDADSLADIEVLAPHFARRAWKGESREDIEERRVAGKDRLVVVQYRVDAMSLLDKARAAAKGPQRAGLGRGVRRSLAQLAVDQTARAIDGTLPVGVAREPYRSQLARLLGGERPRSLILVGRPGAGRATLLSRWVADRLELDGWHLHRNTDRIHRVWRLAGKRLIAGMQYFGDWEARCLDIVEEARTQRGILWFDDLHLFGRLGVTRQSERSFADFFRGPVQRGDLVVIGTATREQLARLEDDASAFAGLFSRIAVEPTSPAQTAALMIAEVRRLEGEHPVTVHPFTPRTVAELAAALFPWTAAPGAPIDLLRKLVTSPGSRTAGERFELGPEQAVALAARETGLPPHLITLDHPLDPAAVEAHFAARVIGQEEAVACAAEVVIKVRAGLTDAARPLGVYLFTGPTGTGKTELATALAEYLYGDPRRLLRFDMSELSGPDAVARLIGDRFAPEGQLTQRIREQPFAVVLLDEIEKAHPAVLALLLQLFDEGRLTDAAGDVASFRHAVVVMTSNLGARAAQPIGFGDTTAAVLGDIARAVRDFFPPELWNRIDRVVRFSPLTPEVAARVVDKELAKLLGRRGLRERNVFVYAGRAVRERAVAQAFDARYGARTVKRWLEDHVAGSLADALIGAAPARMTVARLRDDGAGAIGVDVETLPEAAPVAGDYPLIELRELSAAALEPHAEAAADQIDAALASGVIEEQDRAARASPRADELRYFLEICPDELGKLRRTLGGGRPVRAPVADAEREDELERAHDLEAPARVTHSLPWGPGYVTSVRRFDRRSLSKRRHHRLDQAAALAALARTQLLLDHLDRLAEPEAHAVTVELSVVGQHRGAAGWSALVEALRPWIDEAAARLADGTIVDGTGDGRTPAHLVVVVRELLAGPALAGEHGSHVFQSLTGEPEIVRLTVTPGAVEVRARAAAHRDAVAGFERAVAAGRPAPPNPEPLLPVVRTVSFATPARIGEPLVAELEEFTTGFAGRISAATLPEVVRHAWHLRWSRRGGRR